ncbi:MAG: Rsd/AlgQ family anti-sigma factor [Pseudomonadales bacterium]|nr:Rsd/AlgQ family anti-sigma factor [Pseudomonadales bacterium]
MRDSHNDNKFSDRMDHVIQDWLKERQKLIVLLCSIQDDPSWHEDHVPTGTKVQSFCQTLMDYVSAGHFEIYDALIHEAERCGRLQDLEKAQLLHARLQTSTDSALRFNDLFDDEESCEDKVALAAGLSELGIALEERFQIEDEMLALLHDHPVVESV